MKYRLGIDLGTNSLGWAAIMLKPDGTDRLAPGPLLDMGVRIFSDARNPKDKSSKAAQRRGPRSARRNRDRKTSRGRAMLRALETAELLPAEGPQRKALEALDPWILRARALDTKLSRFEIGRALFHLQQRRGFKSNRKTDSDAEGAVFDAIEDARQKMKQSGARTLGELFGNARLEQIGENGSLPAGERSPLPQARVKARSVGAKLAYDYYPSRAMILDEFDQIWARQCAFHPSVMTENARRTIRQVIEFQRPLKPQPVGKCTFLPDQTRAPKALPSVQYARILQEVNHLRVGAVGDTSRPLSDAERTQVIDSLRRPSSKTAKRTFRFIRKKLLNLPDSQAFNMETTKRDHLVGDTTAAALMQAEAWGEAWYELDLDQQDRIVTRLIETEQEDELILWLVSRHGLPVEKAQAVSRLRLQDGHGKLSAAALARIIPLMEDGKRYDEATGAAFGDHRALGDGEIHEDHLPYYGRVLTRHTAFEKQDPANEEERYGRVANPTVHVALNQLRVVINDLIRRWGPPEQVVLELARDLPLSGKGLSDLEAQQKKNQDLNEQRRRTLATLDQADTYENRLKLRLYEEALEAFGGFAVCVFSGKMISQTELFSDAIEVEHILPLSKTLDDSFANKVLATREANRLKKNKTPGEAFGGNRIDAYDWESIGQRASGLPASKKWRFDPDAMERWNERGGDFLARHLNDTRYIARLGKTFVETLFGGQGAAGQSRNVWVVPGRLTADLRHHAGFNTLTGLTGGNRKDRTDHRHHAVDALVVALTDGSMVSRAAQLARKEDKAQHHDIMLLMAEPLKRYRASAEDRLSKLVVSHKPDHGFDDAMHNDTALGLSRRTDGRGQMMMVTRKPLDALKPNDLGQIVDSRLRRRFIAGTEGLTGVAFTDALINVGESMRPPVRQVRIQTPMKESSFITVRHGEAGRHAKAYKGDGNYCYDIFEDASGRWTGEVISTFAAHQLSRDDPEWWRRKERPDSRPILMRLRKGDMLEIDAPAGDRKFVIVYKFSVGQIYLADHFEANASARIRSKDLTGYIKSPSALQKANAVQVTVSPSGKVKRKISDKHRRENTSKIRTLPRPPV